ncbi:hypothetical protein NicSoilB4_25240 [Arthrobacter sp. NicSoilB4]|uniref:hypothetical protein n=1 Tax=Arthrobacter sp. NicSoilB4 TaxID=2830997 RepID=UPI001CC628DC|nr:hypothetical protein [Arthrobacter sp. NicSoilB4]BCW67761.1 hypothetical protein NicSoilB4_25240 [Arthrobacter sp. NicSoilB4]
MGSKLESGAGRGSRGSRGFLALAVAATLAGCSVGVPDPSAPKAAPAPPTLATPTITPGHDAAAVAAKDMPFTAGETLAAGVPIQLSDGLRDAPGWKPVKENVAGASEYVKEDGCMVAAKVRTSQSALAVSGDDRASTEALFQYLDASILPAYLEPAALRWGGEPGGPAPAVEVLVFEGGERSGTRATAIYARLFSKSGSSVYVSVSCPDAAALAVARSETETRIDVVPPSA